MEHLDFKEFAAPVNEKFQTLAADSTSVLAYAKINVDDLYEVYLSAFPTELNTIFRTRRHYDGSYDKNYIRRLGSVVAVKADGSIDTIWNTKVPGYFKDVAKKLHEAVIASGVGGIFLSEVANVGSKPNKDNALDLIWTHFYSAIPNKYVISKASIGSVIGTFNEDINVFTRGLKELTTDALDTVLELIKANTIYRGAEFKSAVEGFTKAKKAFDKVPVEKQTAYILYTAKILGPQVRFRNTAIGTLVTDLSDGVELDKAVISFEKKVAGDTYKRPTSLALVTPRMIEDAQNKIEELGLSSALDRRFAQVADINVNNVLFTSKNVKALNVFDDLKEDSVSKVSVKALSKIEEISVDHFLQNVLPTAKTVEVLFENKHTSNLVSLLTSVEPNAPHLFKWDNNFSWSYNGEVADSLREQVQALGGRVDGVLRFSHSWNHDGQNQSLMDLHVFGPNHTATLIPNGQDEIHDYYGSGIRVGWNNRKDSITGGNQDVDYTSPPGKSVPVENITFPSLNKLPEGTYTFKIHNWSARTPNTSGFKAEIEFEGNVFTYEHPGALKNKQWITVATATLKNGKFTIDHKMSNEASSKNVWGLDTNKWVKVNNILLSPNVWNEAKRTGNEHLFFLIDNCKNPDSARGIYNEFLKSDFEPHRKVFELLGSKTKAAPCDYQASGLGFSSTRRDKVTVRVTGKTQRTFIINL